MTRTRHRHPRRALGALAVLLWLLGVEVLPGLHLAHHDADDHTHEPGGAIVRVSFDEGTHRHDDGSVHSHAADDEPAHRSAHRPSRGGPEQSSIDQAPSHHAATGIAHHAAALHRPPPPLVAPLHAPLPTRWRTLAPVTSLSTIALARPTARGPPGA